MGIFVHKYFNMTNIERFIGTDTNYESQWIIERFLMFKHRELMHIINIDWFLTNANLFAIKLVCILARNSCVEMVLSVD